jgi:hypothetical protein
MSILPNHTMIKISTLALLLFSTATLWAQKPVVWIYSDASDRKLRGGTSEGTVNDPDDISAMGGYLLMANEFDTRGIVVSSTHRKEHRTTPDQGQWANEYFGNAYRADVTHLNQVLGGYPPDIRFRESCIKKSAEHFDPAKSYASLENYSTVQALLDVARAETNGLINVLCWGSLTEPAILVKHCLDLGDEVTLKKLRFIAHWTDSSLHQGSAEHPENVANCREDARACAYLKQVAREKKITYYECGAIGQHGIVSGSPKGREYFDAFKASRLGTIFIEGKYVQNSVDHSDAATYWALLGKWGVSLQDIASDGTNNPQVEKKNEASFAAWSKRIHDELLRRSNAAGGKPEATKKGGE